MTDPRGHSFGHPQPQTIPPETLAELPEEPASRRRALVALLAASPEWLYALELFNAGYYWEAHEAWEHIWHALGRTTPEARFVQGLIHLAASCVKIREGKPDGVTRHATRARELLGGCSAAVVGDAAGGDPEPLGLDPRSILAVLRELEHHRPECWHTSRTPVVRVLATDLGLGRDARAG